MDAEMRSMFETGLARFSRDRYGLTQWRAYAREPDGYRASLWQEMADMGWLDLIRPASDFGGTLSDLVPLFLASGEALWREPLLEVLGESAGVLLAAAASGAAEQGLIEWIANGTARPAFAHREADMGWANAPLATIAQARDSSYAITGEKAFVVAADTATAFIVSARVAASDRTAAFLVERNAPGVVVEPLRTIDDRGAARVAFSAAPARALVEGHHAWQLARRRSLVLAAAQTVGVMQAVTRMTLAYLQQRKQFGRQLSSFQVLQHRLVEMHLLQRESLALVRATARACDADSTDLPRQLLMLRAQVAGAGRYVTQQAIQMHGGMGMTAELPIGDYYKRVLMLEGLYGSADWALDQLAA